MSVENEERAARRLARVVGGEAWAALRRVPGWGRGVAGALAGCFVLGGALMVVPPDGGDGGGGLAARVVGAAGPEGRTRAVVTAGMPAVLPEVTAAIREREARVRERPHDHASWAVLGVAYTERARRTGTVADYPKAERALHTSLRLRPHGNADALDGLTALANARRDFRTAKQWGEEAVRVTPGRWTSYALLIDAYDGLGRYRAARGTLEKLLTVSSGPAARARAAQVYWDQGGREDAAATIADAAASGTSAAGAAWWVRAGEMAWERGEPEESLRYCEAAGRLTAGGDPDADACRGRALASLGRAAEGVRAYRVALSRRPSAEVALRLGELYESLGRAKQAREQYGVVRTLVGRSVAAGVNESLVLGALESDHGDPEVAVRVLRAEWERQPSLRVADALGWALHRAGKDEEALGYARRATDKEHGGEVRSADYLYHRGAIEQALGRAAPARRHLAEARRLNPYFSVRGESFA
ncbi:tetratricopeptide repeat protein [Streptomyces sp. DSM 40750]|uniref:tetratricopeptide repeat protein n=1 Tax=Streptomyces sp. DSM 40750 TaxID=2801030 RepID=UPI00214B88B7|nr:tetratricopeptide repeat protein [Streptomyces sp. DSM 40750]UUU22494.1 tetratricopeptide repeat protein [Streptomyces sp. DSM 40750]